MRRAKNGKSKRKQRNHSTSSGQQRHKSHRFTKKRRNLLGKIEHELIKERQKKKKHN